MNNENLEGEFLEYASIVKLTEGQEMTLLEMNAAFTTLKNGVDLFKTWGDLKDVNALRIIASMERELFNLETELLNRDKKIAQLKEQLDKPQNKPQLIKLRVLNEDYWYSQTDVDNPICSACYDSLDKIIRLVSTDRSTKMMTKHKYQCPNCKTTS